MREHVILSFLLEIEKPISASNVDIHVLWGIDVEEEIFD